MGNMLSTLSDYKPVSLPALLIAAALLYQRRDPTSATADLLRSLRAGRVRSSQLWPPTRQSAPALIGLYALMSTFMV